MTVLIIRTKKVARDQAPHCRRKEKKTASEGSREVPRVFLFPPLQGLVPGYKERREKACADEFQITAYSYIMKRRKNNSHPNSNIIIVVSQEPIKKFAVN